MWELKNVFLEFLKKSAFWSKRAFSTFLGHVFVQVSSFWCWGPPIRKLSSKCGNLKMCFGIFFKSVYFGRKWSFSTFRTFFWQVSSFWCWGPPIRNICSKCGNLKMCLASRTGHGGKVDGFSGIQPSGCFFFVFFPFVALIHTQIESITNLTWVNDFQRKESLKL